MGTRLRHVNGRSGNQTPSKICGRAREKEVRYLTIQRTIKLGIGIRDGDRYADIWFEVYERTRRTFDGSYSRKSPRFLTELGNSVE
jgi:hypothetical protein